MPLVGPEFEAYVLFWVLNGVLIQSRGGPVFPSCCRVPDSAVQGGIQCKLGSRARRQQQCGPTKACVFRANKCQILFDKCVCESVKVCCIEDIGEG